MSSLSTLGWFVIAAYFGVLFLISVAVIVVLSCSAASPKPGQVRGLTLATINREDVRQSYDRKDIAATAVVFGLAAAVYLYFSFWV